MKGYFSIKHDRYTETLTFGNLTSETGNLGSMRDALDDDVTFPIGRLIAHDVVEHSLAHRTKTYVTYEDEIRAVGAIEFVRHAEFDMYMELEGLVGYLHRDLKPVPYIVGKHLLDSGAVSVDLIKHLIASEVSPANARKAAFHYAWGHEQKSRQFNDCNYTARNAFTFIESNVDFAISEIDLHESWGASVYFDTEKHIFRTRMKWEH